MALNNFRNSVTRAGKRSKLEDSLSAQLERHKIQFLYEELVIPYKKPELPEWRKLGKYTPDFVLPNGIVVEAKGWMMPKDRQLHMNIKEQYPDLDIRFLFTNSNNKLNKDSKSTYRTWCNEHGVKFGDLFIPPSWFKEPTNKKSLACILKLLGRKSL